MTTSAVTAPKHGDALAGFTKRTPREAKSYRFRRTDVVDIVIVDKSPLVRAGLVHTLRETRFRVIGEYSSVAAFAKHVLKKAIVLIGFDRADGDGIANLISLVEKGDLAHLIILGEDLDKQEFDLAMSLCCDAYILKYEITPEILLSSIELVLLKGKVFSPEFMEMVKQHLSGATITAAAEGDRGVSNERLLVDAQRVSTTVELERGRLSARETTILMGLMKGESNKHIARELDITEATVKVHVKSVLRKIQARNRTQAATWALARSSQLGLGAEEPRATA